MNTLMMAEENKLNKILFKHENITRIFSERLCFKPFCNIAY